MRYVLQCPGSTQNSSFLTPPRKKKLILSALHSAVLRGMRTRSGQSFISFEEDKVTVE